MAWVAVAVAGSTLVSGYLSSEAQSDASSQASQVQAQSSAEGIAEKRRQFDKIQELLKPYVDAGGEGLMGQKNLLGLNGPDAERAAVAGIEGGPTFDALAKQGEQGILQNASATGGLRGGNVQAALSQFRPNLLAQLINQQYSRLGGITTLGQNSAALTGNAGLSTGTDIANLLQQSGAAQAGGYLSAGKAEANQWGNAAGAVGQFAALGGFGKF